MENISAYPIVSSLMIKGRAFTFRELGREDLSEMLALEELVIDDMEKKEDLRSVDQSVHIRRLNVGCTYGVFDEEGNLVSFYEHTFPEKDPQEKNLMEGHLPVEELSKVVYAARCVRHPSEQYQGYSLMAVLQQKILSVLSKKGYEYFCGTVAPGNIASQKSFEKNGATLLEVIRTYGDQVRNVMAGRIKREE
ncbi:hypothetical protein HC823_01035 [Candidatus Gracilibacteria bacterium]|nr:hypothetical protein [Candidatus Gracilibacteria bacterium]